MSRQRPEKGILVLFFSPLAQFFDFGLVFRSPVIRSLGTVFLILGLFFGTLSRTYFGVGFWSCFSVPCHNIFWGSRSCFSVPCQNIFWGSLFSALVLLFGPLSDTSLHDHDGGYGLHSWSRKGPVFRSTSNLI